MSLGFISICAVFSIAWWRHPTYEVTGFRVAPALLPQRVANARVGSTPFFSSGFASSDVDEFVHAAAITSLRGGDLMAVWFAGSREGAADVQIRGARYDAASSEWSKEFVLATRESTQAAAYKYIRKLGNPVIALAPNDRLWLFYVSVSIGGWGGSAISAMYSDDFGTTWSAPEQLVTTPFLNISTLVRAAPVFHVDGSLGLPVYHEFLGKFGEYLYLSADGEVLDKSRISRGRQALQPTIVPLDGQRAVALLRNADDVYHKVLASWTEDAGQTWSEPERVDPNNPNSSLAAVATPSQGLLVALNDLRDGRFRLSLFGTNFEMTSWTLLMELDESPSPIGNPFAPEVYREIIEDKFRGTSCDHHEELLEGFLGHLDQRVCAANGCEFEYEYPYLIRSGDGYYHLVYSWNNIFIKHISFNDAWLEALI